MTRTPEDPATGLPPVSRRAAQATPGRPATSPPRVAGGNTPPPVVAPSLPRPEEALQSPQSGRGRRPVAGKSPAREADPAAVRRLPASPGRGQTPAVGAVVADTAPSAGSRTYTIALPATVTFTVPGEPKSKSRHRTGVRGGKIVHYKDDATARAQDAVGVYYRQKRGPGKPDGVSGFGVSMVFNVGTRQRRDVDNFVKLILDGLTGFAWADDSQVTEISARIRHGDADPRSEVTVYGTDDLPDWSVA